MQEFEFMLSHNIIRPSHSQWASPLHIVSKKDGSSRVCGDYRRLNALTIPDRYPLPRMEQFQYMLHGKKFFSKIDLFKAYYQIPIVEEDKCKTAITTPFGLYEFNVMSFGLRNAPATFQRFVHNVFRGFDFIFSYLDDNLIASETLEEHKQQLKSVFDRLAHYGLRINLSKSIFCVQELEFLGYQISPGGIKPLPSKVKALSEYKLPETLHQLRTFLGFINFYRSFMPNAAKNQSILHDYLKGAKKKDSRKVPWTESGKKQFELCKSDLLECTMLANFNPDLQLALFCDASDIAIGSVLQQKDGNNWQPLAFYSKKLNTAQQNYSTYDKELLGIYLSVKHFQHLLEARQFIIFTDHKPLTYALSRKAPKKDTTVPRQIRYLHYISQFCTDIRHVSGKDNIIADTLSRLEEISIIDYEKIASAQVDDEELSDLKINSSLQVKKQVLPTGNNRLLIVTTDF